jgi:hypothetical protein
MSVNEESTNFGMTEGCPIHGDEHMKECTMCGAEFCRICFPKSPACPDCSEQDEDEDEDADFDDVGNEDEDDEEEEKEEEDDDEEDSPPEDLAGGDNLRQF